MTVVPRGALRRVTTVASRRKGSSVKLANIGTFLSTAVDTVVDVTAITFHSSMRLFAALGPPTCAGLNVSRTGLISAPHAMRFAIPAQHEIPLESMRL